MNSQKVVIVGGGFAGINLAQKLSRNKHFEITLVDKNNYNFFPPLLYQVATGFLEASNISYPFRKFFQVKITSGSAWVHFRKYFPLRKKSLPTAGISIMTTWCSLPAPRAITLGWRM